MAIQKAVRYQRKLRVGAAGPTGAGKSLTCLKLATFIAEQIPGARVGVIDTENFSASVYADEFDFDVIGLSSFAPDDYIRAIEEFERADQEYVLLIDGLTQAWAGRGGALEQVDKKVLQGGDSFTAWRTVSPQHNRLVDKLINYRGHLFVTLRSKMAHELEKDEKTGKNKVVKLGMAPVMRDGIEYEFDVFFELDQDHTCMASKTRARELDGYVENKPGEGLARKLWEWSQGNGAPEAPERPIDQLGAFAAPDGALNSMAFMAELGRRGLTVEDLAKVAIPANGKTSKADITRWLEANPRKTLVDLLNEVKAAKVPMA